MKTKLSVSPKTPNVSILLKQHLKQYKTQKEAENNPHYTLIKQLLIDKVTNANKEKRKRATQLLQKILLILQNER